MSSDIRAFFSGNRNTFSGQGSSPANGTKKAVKPRGRAKRKVVSDSDDDEEPAPRKSTPKKLAPKKHLKKDSPAGEVTTTSDYFASTGKSKPARLTPIKPRAHAPENHDKVVCKPSTKNASPNGAATAATVLSGNGNESARKRSKTGNVKNQDKDNLPFTKADNDTGNDIFVADYKIGKAAPNEYQSDDEEDKDGDVMRTRRVPTRGKQASLIKDENTAVDVESPKMKDVDVEDPNEKPDPKERIQKARPVNRRKRKSLEIGEDSDRDGEADDLVPPKKKSNGTPAKKPSKKLKIKESRERTTVDDIIDNIPIIRPPSPPPADGKPVKPNFYNHAARMGPGPGSRTKEIPEGAKNCLAGQTFVFTGLLDALGRDEGQELVKRYGGKVTTAPSSKTSFVVLGNDAGPKKLETIAKFNLKTINEDGLFALIRNLPANGGDSKAAEQYEKKMLIEEQKMKDAVAEIDKEERKREATIKKSGSEAEKIKENPRTEVDNRLWTVKYAPTSTSMVCGNKGQVEKLQAWLRTWHINKKSGFRKAGASGMGVYRAVMIHGPPGIGKTTAAHLVAKIEGYDVVESNASDTRSKKLVETGLRGVLDTTSLLGYFAGDGKKVDNDKQNLVLIMDEVDGMSAGDRGGVGALAAVCKKTSVPMILICNDRKLPKMRPFDQVTFDLPFRRPTMEQIRGRLATIAFREKLQISGSVLGALIEGSHSDIRQVINMLSTAKLDQAAMDYDQGKSMSKSWEKSIILKPWDIVSKIIGGGMFASSSTSNLNNKIELYFNDHEFSSLMLQENYLGTNPTLSSNYTGKEKNLKLLGLTDKAAESISDGDLVDRMIHGSQQQWSLMPTHAVLSFVRPASFVAGSMAGHQTRFTSWLGNNSKQSKLIRYVKDIQGHMRLRASGDRHEIRQQYLPVLWYKLVKELEIGGKESVEDVIELMDSYFLTKDDWDAILELGLGPMDMETINLATQTKAAFTRTYNQKSHPLPFMKASNVSAPKKASKEKPDLEEAIDESDSGEDLTIGAEAEDEDDKLDLKKDKYVKASKKKKAKAEKVAGKKKGNSGKQQSDDELDDEEESEEVVKPKKGRGLAKGKSATAKGRAKI